MWHVPGSEVDRTSLRESFPNDSLQEREQIHAQSTAKAIETVALTQAWVLERLMENAERALQHVAVLDKERKPTGEYRYDSSVANRALELLGKQQGKSFH